MEVLKMAINIDDSLLNKSTKELISLLNDKDYSNSLKIINKEIRYLRDQNRRLSKSLENEKEVNDLIEYTYDRQMQQRSNDIEQLKEIRQLVKRAKKDPRHVRLTSGILRFGSISLRNQARRKITKEARTLRGVVSQRFSDTVEVFFDRGYLKNYNYRKINKPRLNHLLNKYLGVDFDTSLKTLLPAVKPDSMSNDVSDKIHDLAYEYIAKTKLIQPVNDTQISELIELTKYLSDLNEIGN